MSTAVRTHRIEARVSRDQKKLLQQAAKLQGRTVTEFVVSSAQEAARRVIEEQEVMRLTAKDREAFVASLLDPPVLTGRLASALDRYRHLFER